MSDPAATAQRQQLQQKGLFVGLLTLPFRFAAVLFGSLLLSIVIECVGMYVFWPDEGWRHAQRMYEFEVGQLSDDFKRSALVQEPGRTAGQLTRVAYQLVMVETGIAKSVQITSWKASEVRTEGPRNARYYVGTLYTHIEKNLIAAAFTVLVFLVRLLVLFLSLPLFIIAAFIGLVDGLVCRDIRRFGAGRESGYLYHRVKACLLPLATLPWVLYLAIPMSVDAGLILVPGAVCLGTAVALTSRSFKKYL
ncbi:TIGR03747 family integrating conjugative element membrane protein [Pseudomonas fluorescens]|jgi:integrating conjugative element membrane protein (TIGR03747 family)|uniref:TIGR03747 family integrating conjugative element membrane protein n=1 Tax=Pseudomonas fluorescens TaxID=294 RepID=UPI0013981B1C|nr:TIGR03747 family integrating conjugative element membrane protein [Pseudomonas fluorescens]QIA03518.1 TIGR03747 family integrating conjugative element membrane protein [Pseudomonas fluorescens]